VVAERRAVIASDGTRLFRVERHDRTATVKSCDCLEENAADCKVTGKVVVPGLRAFDLAGGDPIVVEPNGDDELIGADFDFSVDLVGGAGSLLFVESNDSGYECGAHGNSSGAVAIVDLVGERRDARAFEALGKKLPAQVLADGAAALLADYKECEGEDATLERAKEQARLESVSVSIGPDGAPRLAWSYGVDVYYACSVDYLVHGTARTGLIAEAGDVGLAGPLPGGMLKAMAAAAEKSTVGWSKLTLAGDARDVALTAFRAAPEPAWPGRQPIVEGGGAEGLVKAGRELTIRKDYSAAIAKFSEAIAADAALATAWSGRGYANLLNDTLDAAKGDLDKAAELGGDALFLAQVQFNRGQVAEKQGDKAGARAAYERSLALRPHKSVEKALARVRE
jgi:tetratricopeptide (TPR) repeat protein